FHEGPDGVFSGEATIERGRNPAARWLAGAFGFPPDGRSVPVVIMVERGRGARGTEEHWHRSFDGHRLSTRLSVARPGRVIEAVGPSVFELILRVDQGRLHLEVAAGRLFGLPLPRFLLPVSEAVEFAEHGTFAFDIAVRLFLIGPMIRYRGWLKPVA
ncbi:MAG: DUF4166 domain-containing protein, partial [Pseudomonadota bacterium]